MNKERWRWIPGYEGLYMVSDKGRVFSTPKITAPGSVLKQKTTVYGYKTVQLSRDGEVKDCRVHRLVALAFLKRRQDQNEVNHKNGNKADNSVENLEWCTQSENALHAFHVLGRKPSFTWKDKPRLFARVLTDDEVRAIRQDTRPSRVIGNIYGVSKTTILNIKSGKIYKEVM
ncbi:MAG: NUMOD4 motif-containing HNH endonuclease [Atopobiaceae bacterium]|nr:NUMOD4 motif-containing HNH endonuclease [Atopobiaceae bacterium]MBR4614302.1 NUMOD4 motif-containing HNH endonuclease [Kiritimatiellia bacterium]